MSDAVSKVPNTGVGDDATAMLCIPPVLVSLTAIVGVNLAPVDAESDL